MDQMQKYEELNKRMDRIKVLMDASNKSMEELLALGGMVVIDECNDCPLKHECVAVQLSVNPGTGLYWSCEDLWTAYLKGELDEKT